MAEHSGHGVVTAPAGYAVDVLPGVGAIPAQVWDGLAPADDPMWARQVFAAMEQGAIGPDEYAYVVVRSAGEICAILPLAAFRELRLDDVVGSGERRLLAPVRRLFPRLLRVPMLFCGNFLGPGRVLSRGPLQPEVCELLVRAVLRYARRNRLGTVVFKDFAPECMAALRPQLAAAGFFFVPSLPDTELRLGHVSFDDYIAALPAKARRNVRSTIRNFRDHPGLRIEVRRDFADLLPAMLGLYQQVMVRADQTLDVLDGVFLRALSDAEGLEQRVVACFDGDKLVAFLHCFFRGHGAVGVRIGLDYRLAHRARLYHNVHYAAIELAIAEKCQHIRFAQTAYEPKRELGCALVEQSYAITHIRAFPRAVLRRLLPPALASARADALAPRS
ncbi:MULTISPECIES: GNAT family N-acetyltransferase [unclassified Frankia]|uniref:GNAT family N-acetyltransferase n=1 Tax=unclassified Frankia TaxID=2632575 RepID=UPI001EF6B870|nr:MULTISPECIES: GNAT family N-acetyltransferase [unclassified Frankia]